MLRLADLLLVGVEATRKIADVRVNDRDELHEITLRAEQMAADLRRICERGGGLGRRTN